MSAKPSWPKLADGTTDWETVFEDPDTGLITVIVQAKTKDFLKQCAAVVIRDLFTRDNDQPEVARLTEQLDTVLSDAGDDMAAATASVALLLRGIKDDRKQRAKAYLAEKYAAQGGERRKQKSGKKPSAAAKRDPLVLAISAAIAVCVIGLGIVGVMLYGGSEEIDDRPDESAEVNALKAQPKPAPAPKSEPEAEFPKSMALQPVVLSITSTSGVKKRLFYTPVIEITGRPQQSAICKAMPWIKDILITTLSRQHPKHTAAGSTERERMGDDIAKSLRPRLGALAPGKVVLSLGIGDFRSLPMACR